MASLHDPINNAVRENLHGFDELTASLLARRGITTNAEAEAFLSPSYENHLGDPLLIKNMEKAAKRIIAAMEAGEKIVVWSDYDCDGVPGGVVLHDFLKKIGANFSNYIPHRHEEGFGLHTAGLEKLAASGAKLIVTVDCGISDVEAVAHANNLGMEVIITDHHLPGEEVPAAYTIVDAKQEGETYSYTDFCGAGMAWKLVCAILAIGFPGREKIPVGWEKWLLDMAGLATIADMVPLTGENRVIAKYGLLVMRKSPRLGFQKLCKAARVNQRMLTEDDIGFMLAPRINAASRMGDAMDAFVLFTTTDENEADALAKKLEATNRSRRAMGAAITKKVHERIEERYGKSSGAGAEEMPAVIVMGDPDWRPGLLGIVANNLSEEYQRPVFLWGREGSDTLKGSCRAGRKDLNLLTLMQTAASDTFREFGGHSASGGFSVEEDSIHFLDARMQEAFAKLSFEALEDENFADAELALAQATPSFLIKLEKMSPFGMGNPKPVFILRDATIETIAWFGKGTEHLRLTITENPQQEKSSSVYAAAKHRREAISFFAKRELGAACEKLTEGSYATFVVTLERDTFTKGQPVRLRIVSMM